MAGVTQAIERDRSLTLPAPTEAPTPEPGASATGVFARTINAPLVALVVAGVWTYRVTLGWLIGGQCRFTPSCSQYMLDAVRAHGPWRGGWMGVRRVCRCHPLGGHGYDPA